VVAQTALPGFSERLLGQREVGFLVAAERYGGDLPDLLAGYETPVEIAGGGPQIENLLVGK
jgi:hypothetical protein